MAKPKGKGLDLACCLMGASCFSFFMIVIVAFYLIAPAAIERLGL